MTTDGPASPAGPGMPSDMLLTEDTSNELDKSNNIKSRAKAIAAKVRSILIAELGLENQTMQPKIDPYACEECGSPYCEPCFDRDEDGEYQDSEPSHWLCKEHAHAKGYCFMCGQNEPDVKGNPSGLCAECQIEAIREENYGEENYGDEA